MCVRYGSDSGQTRPEPRKVQRITADRVEPRRDEIWAIILILVLTSANDMVLI